MQEKTFMVPKKILEKIFRAQKIKNFLGFCTENHRFSCDPKSKTAKLKPHSKEYGFRFMDII